MLPSTFVPPPGLQERIARLKAQNDALFCASAHNSDAAYNTLQAFKLAESDSVHRRKMDMGMDCPSR